MEIRVRREDLQGSDGDSSSDAGSDDVLAAQLNAQIAAALGIIPQEISRPAATSTQTKPTAAKRDDTPSEDDGDDGAKSEDGYEFNLFSTSGPAAKVVLEDTAMQGDGGFVRSRPRSFYTSTDISAKERQHYELAAVGADQVLEWSRQRSWGMELPWKVRHIKMMRKAKPGDKATQILQEVQAEESSAARKRPGKKQRILLRQRTRAKEQKAADNAKQMLEKEEHLKDKKKRLNRIKKLRKRAKEKDKKLAAGADAAAPGSDASGGESGVDE